MLLTASGSERLSIVGGSSFELKIGNLVTVEKLLAFDIGYRPVGEAQNRGRLQRTPCQRGKDWSCSDDQSKHFAARVIMSSM